MKFTNRLYEHLMLADDFQTELEWGRQKIQGGDCRIVAVGLLKLGNKIYMFELLLQIAEPVMALGAE